MQKNRLQVAKYNESGTVFFVELVLSYGYVVKVSVRQLDFDSCKVLKLSAAPWPFCVALSSSVH